MYQKVSVLISLRRMPARFGALLMWAGVLGLTALPAGVQSRTILVAPSAGANAPGIPGGRIYTSINEAIRSAVAGDTVSLLPGRYSELIVISRKIGTDRMPILISGTSEKADEYPVIDGGATRPSARASNLWITVVNSAWIEFSRIEFRNGWTFPIQVENSSYISFLSCRFFGAKRVISAGGDSTHHLLLDHCYWDQGGEFLWTVRKDSTGTDAWTSMHHGTMSYFNGSLIDFSGTGGSVVVRYNTIVNAFNGVRFRGQKGHDTNVEIYGNTVTDIRDNDFEPEYYAYNLHMYHNTSHNIHRTLSVDEVEGGNIYYYGNVVTTDTDPWSTLICAGFWKIIAQRRKLSFPLYAFNNSFYGTGQAFSTRRGSISLMNHWNNAYYFSGSNGWFLDRWGTGNAFDYDVSNKPWPPSLVGNAQEGHGKIADVRYVDPAHRDLRLAPASPCVDAGKVVSLKEFDWTQAYTGSAPNVGAFEGAQLVEGPPFRFLLPPGVDVVYRERPRIVRHRIAGDSLVIWFSERIDPRTVKQQTFSLWKADASVPVTGVVLADDYRLIITGRSIPAEGELSLGLPPDLRGRNGENVTSWASTVKIRK